MSYFVCAVLSVAAALLVYLYLRRSFASVAESASGKHLPTLLKRLFPCGLIFPALLGFLSVSYYDGCSSTYEGIVANRELLVAKNHQQISAILFYVVVAVLVWNFIALLILRSSQRGNKEQ
jgi:hypothetical protein